MVWFEEPNILQLENIYNSNERVYYNETAKTMLQVWEGKGDGPDELFRTVELNRDSRRYIHIRVKNIINNAN